MNALLPGVDAIPFISGLLTGMATVLLTFWIQRIRRKILALRALEAEIVQNRNTAKEVIHDMAEMAHARKEAQPNKMSNQFRPTDVSASPTNFNLSAYESFKNSGLFHSSSKDLKIKLDNHYRWLESANKGLDERENLRASIKGRIDNQRYHNAVLEQERLIINNAAQVTSDEILDDIQSEVSGEVKDWLRKFIRDVIEPKQEGVNFEEMEYSISSALGHYPIIRRIV